MTWIRLTLGELLSATDLGGFGLIDCGGSPVGNAPGCAPPSESLLDEMAEVVFRAELPDCSEAALADVTVRGQPFQITGSTSGQTELRRLVWETASTDHLSRDRGNLKGSTLESK